MGESEVELAPGHKVGLPLPGPVMLGAGSVGYGEARPKEMETGRFGGVVVGPITRRSRGGSAPPRMAETVGGFVRNVGLQNRGVSAAVRRYGKLWPRLGCPVIAQIADSRREEAAETAARLTGVEGIEGFEILSRPDADARGLRELLEAMLLESDLPVLVKVPLAEAETLAPVAVEAGASGVVVGSPPLGAGVRGDGQTVRGELFGPGVFAMTMAALMALKALALPCSLVACGGIHTVQQARDCLAAGADALQLDSLVWVEPAAATVLAAALHSG